MTFEETKQRKLQRLLGLRIMNWLGMVSWIDGGDGEAKQMLRLVHPLTWVWLVSVSTFGIFMQGVPDTVSDVKYAFKHETVLW